MQIHVLDPLPAKFWEGSLFHQEFQVPKMEVRKTWLVVEPPIWKIWVKMGFIFRKLGVKIKSIWNHNTVIAGYFVDGFSLT